MSFAAAAPKQRNPWYSPSGQFTQEDPIGLAGGLSLYGYGNGDALNNADPFGLKVDLSRLSPGQRARIRSLRQRSRTFRQWYDAIDSVAADQLTLYVQNALGVSVDAVRNAGDGLTIMGTATPSMLLSADENWASQMEFEAVVAHEFAHAAAGLFGGTPVECYDKDGGRRSEDCATTAQNRVHKDIGLRDRSSYEDTGPFKPTPEERRP